jgi:hypothetical protein
VTDGPVAGTASCTSYKRGEATTCTLNGSGFVAGGVLWIGACTGYVTPTSVTSTKITAKLTWACNCELMNIQASYKNPDGKKADWSSIGSTVMGKTIVTEHWPTSVKKGTTLEYGFNGCNLGLAVWIGCVELSNIRLQAQDQVLATGKAVCTGSNGKAVKKYKDAIGDDAWSCNACMTVNP